jgi:hypothetical protein
MYPLNQQNIIQDSGMDQYNTIPNFKQQNSQQYRVEVRGHLDPNWSDWFDGLTLTHDPSGNTIMIGDFVDQAALYGLLNKVRNLGLHLVSVNPIQPSN